MSDTPETEAIDEELSKDSFIEAYEGMLFHARKLERERDELREAVAIFGQQLEKACSERDEISERFDGLAKAYESREKELHELRAEVAAKQKLIELHCRDWADDDTRIKAVCEKHGIITENTGDYFKSAVECVEQLADKLGALKADNARLDFLEKTSCAQYLEGPCAWAINSWSEPLGETLRDAIDAAMKGPE